MNMEQLFRKCKFSKRYLGYQALQECVLITLEDEEALLFMTGIYMDAAKRCHTSWKQVERNIRTMLDCSWKAGGKETLEQISGGVLYAKPSVGEVIEIFTYYLKEHPEINRERE